MTDVLIIGSGPAGMTAAIYAKRANLNVLIAEKEYEGTGQMAESSRIDNYPGFYGINGYELGEKIREHAEALGIAFLEEEAVSIQKTADGFDITMESGNVQNSKTVIYTAGAAHRKLAVPGSEKFENKGISYCASCDGAFYQGKDVAVIGGGNSALDDALLLSEICNKVDLIPRRAEFRGDASTLAKLEQKENVEIIRNANVQEITGDGKAEILLLDTGAALNIQGVFVAIGMIPQTDAVKDLVDLDESGYVKAGEDGITSEPGFFVAGDVRTKELRQIITAAADGANAANSAIQYIIRK